MKQKCLVKEYFANNKTKILKNAFAAIYSFKTN